MLEAVRHYAAEKLAESELDPADLRRRHADYFAAFGERHTRRMRTADEAAALDALAPAYDNLRSALDFSASHAAPETTARLAVILYQFLFRRGFWGEARTCLQTGLEATATSEPCRAARASILHYLATIEIDTEGEEALAREHEELSLELRRAVGDASGMAESLNQLANSEIRAGRWEAARTLLEQALPLLPEGDHQRRGILLHSLARVANGGGDATKARELYELSLTARRAAGDYRGEAETLGNLGVLAHNAGDVPQARRLYLESLAILRRLRDRFATAVVLFNLGELAELDAEAEKAVALYYHAEKLFRDLQSSHAGAARGRLEKALEGFSPELRNEALASSAASAWENLA
jgi:tetratricopeptide (TPR) repeat protein